MDLETIGYFLYMEEEERKELKKKLNSDPKETDLEDQQEPESSNPPFHRFPL